MKIAFVSLMEGYIWGGSEELWYKVACEAICRNHSVQICTNQVSFDSPKVIELKKRGATIIARTEPNIFSKLLKKMSFGKIAVLPNYLKQIKQFEPDVFLISQGGTYDFFYRADLINFISEIGQPFFLISQFNAENGWIQTERIKKIIGTPSLRLEKFYFVSARNLKSTERQLVYKIKNSSVVSNPINIHNIGIAQWPKDQILNLACVARFECAYKGQDILLETLAEPEFQHVNFKLSFFGKGPDENHIRSLIDYFQLSEKVSIKEFTSDIDNIWAHHHVLILPSLGEGTPLSLQEAMLKGRPALTTDVGGSDTLIIDNETGFLADTASVRCLRKKLLELFSKSDDELRVMGEKAFEVASSKINLNSYMDILKDLEMSIKLKSDS